jgi:CBS domain-containing protein
MEGPVNARDIMTANPTCCTPDDTAQSAAREMVASDCGCLPVVDDRETRRIVGVVTDRDLASRCLAEGLGPDTRVQDVMSSNPSCCSVDDDVRDVERLMADRQVRRVPIVDGEQRCVGIVAQADIARDEKDFDDHEVRQTIERISEPTRQGTV